jgi:group II intron reverse transcriptase/maturase
MRGNSPHGNREIPQVPVVYPTTGRPKKVYDHTFGVYACGKSDGRIVPRKPPNKGAPLASAEAVEGRRPTSGNTAEPAAPRTQSRESSASLGLARVRQVARRDKRAKFTALLHHVTVEMLRESYHALERAAAPGVDGVTWQQYREGLEDRLVNLHRQVHSGTYRAQPSRRIYIPKADGRLRPLGIAALEDKIVQHAVVRVLSAVYEEDFLGFSYGFRPGRSQHQALDALWVGLMGRKVNWVLDVDIRAFFDSIDHAWMLKFIGHRIADPRMLRLLAKWLRAGVSEDGQWSETKVGTPQGAVASPLLANVYLHYVLDLWANQWRKRQAKGEVIIVRYADDFVMGFQHQHEAQRFLADLKSRVEQFGLSLHPDKTRLIEFGRFADQNRRKREGRKPETFDFLGFTHVCAKKHWSGGFIVRRRSIKKRLRAKLVAVKQALQRRRHLPIPQQGAFLRSVIQGFLNYHAVPGNMPALGVFCRECTRHWLAALRRRGQRHLMSWQRLRPWIDRLIPSPVILHPYPNDRFYARHPK